MRKGLKGLAAIVALLGITSFGTVAQAAYPERPVTLVGPWGAGVPAAIRRPRPRRPTPTRSA